MSPIRPMLGIEGSAEVELSRMGKASAVQFPCVAQIKYDGFRCIFTNSGPTTRKLEPIGNRHVRKQMTTVFGTHDPSDMENHPLLGMDGELIALDYDDLSELDLHKTQSRLSAELGHPRFVYHVFDDFLMGKSGYLDRQTSLNSRLERIRHHVYQAKLEENHERLGPKVHDHVFQIVPSKICERIEDILEFEAEVLRWGGEGIMLRGVDSKYKFGRSTLKEFACVKVKRFTDSSAKIVGFVEKMRNDNEMTMDAQGYAKRSTSKSGKVPANTLGALRMYWPENDVEFEVGTGWDAATAKEIWDNQKKYVNTMADFRYKGIGPNGKPLISSFQGMRYDL